MAIRLTVIRHKGMVNIDNDDIAYARIEEMYIGNQDGVGLQINNESQRDVIQSMCDTIADAVRDYENLAQQRQ